MEYHSQNNAWVESYLDALLTEGLSKEYVHNAKERSSDAEKDIHAQYYVNQILGFNEEGIVSAWRKAQAARGPTESKDARLQYLSWRVWGMQRQRERARLARAAAADDDSSAPATDSLHPDDPGSLSCSFDVRPGASQLERRFGSSMSLSQMRDLQPVRTGAADAATPADAASPVSGAGTSAQDNLFSGRVDKLYLVLISMHGLVRGHNMELGRDADTGGQVKYVVELAKTLSKHPMVHRVDLMTRLIEDPAVPEDYGQPEEQLEEGNGSYGGAYIVRVKAGDSSKYLPKEELWPHVREFADHGLMHVKAMLKTMTENGEPCDLYAVHGHYADAGEVAALMAHSLGADMVLTGHSLGRNKLDHLLKSGTVSRQQIEETYKISRRIEGEERALDAAIMVLTSTQQEVDAQWGLYDGYEKDMERALRYRRKVGRHMPRMNVIPPGLDFSSLKVELPADPMQLFVDYEAAMMDTAKTLHAHVSHGALNTLAGPGADAGGPTDLTEDELVGPPPSADAPPSLVPTRGALSQAFNPELGGSLRRSGGSLTGSMRKINSMAGLSESDDVFRGAVPVSATHVEEDPPIWQQVKRFLRNPRKPVVLAMSRPDAKKNITTLVKAFGSNQALRDIANLVLIMGNRDNIDSLAKGSQQVIQQVLKLIDTHDLYGSVAYPKAHSQQDISDIYLLPARTRGVFTNIALQEPFGLTLIEAAVHGVPIVATKHGGPVDIIRTLKNGVTVEPTDAEAVGDAILDIITDSYKWDQFSHAGVANILAYSWPSHCIKYLEAIEREKRRAALRGGAQRASFDHDRFDSMKDDLEGDRAQAPAAEMAVTLEQAKDLLKATLDDRAASLPAIQHNAVAEVARSLAQSTLAADDLGADLGPATAAAAEASLRVAGKSRILYTVLDTTYDVNLLIKALKTALDCNDGSLAIGVVTILTFSEVCRELECAGLDARRLDFVVCNCGAYILCMDSDGETWVADEAWEAKTMQNWDKQLVVRTLTRMHINRRAPRGAAGAGESELMRVEGTGVDDGRGPLHALLAFDPHEGSPLEHHDNATLITSVRKRVRQAGVRCNLTLHLVPEDGAVIKSTLHATPLRASRALALRHLALTHSLALRGSLFLCTPATVATVDGGSHTLGALCSDMVTLIQGSQRVVVVPPSRPVALSDGADGGDARNGARRGKQAFEKLKVDLEPYDAARVTVLDDADGLPDFLRDFVQQQ